MLTLIGQAMTGLQHFGNRIRTYPSIFHEATGEHLFPGTFNVRVNCRVKPVAHFEILGARINEPEQDLWFEIVRVNGLWAYRIRPMNLLDGSGGHGDDIIEIASAVQFRTQSAIDMNSIRIDFFGKSFVPTKCSYAGFDDDRRSNRDILDGQAIHRIRDR